MHATTGAESANEGSASVPLRQLAAQLDRPAQSLAAMDQLDEQALVLLNEAVTQAASRERDKLDAAYRAAFPPALRALVMTWLKRGGQ